jgi:hypothetical protein
MSATASKGGAYVPPFAATTAARTTAKATGTSLTFAKIGTLSGTAATSGTATAATTAAIVDSTGGVDSSSLLEYFTKVRPTPGVGLCFERVFLDSLTRTTVLTKLLLSQPYIDAHTLSIPTWRYAYFLWIIIVATLVFWSAAYHLSGSGTGGSALGAWFRKYSIRRIMIGGKNKTKKKKGGTEGGTTLAAVGGSKVLWASPTFAQMATIVGLIGVALCLSLAGDDYISVSWNGSGGRRELTRGVILSSRPLASSVENARTRATTEAAVGLEVVVA